MVNTPFNRRNNEFEGDMAAYLRSVASDNDAAISRLKRNLRLARQEELTPRQAQLLHLYFDEEMTMTEIARALNISKSTVSRTISRAKGRLERCLRYAF